MCRKRFGGTGHDVDNEIEYVLKMLHRGSDTRISAWNRQINFAAVAVLHFAMVAVIISTAPMLGTHCQNIGVFFKK